MRRIIAIVLALAAAVAALFFGRQFVEGQRHEVMVATARQDIPAFTRIEMDMLAPVRIAADSLLPGMVINPQELVGGLTGRAISKGQPVLIRDLHQQAGGRDFLGLIEGDQRGIAISVTLPSAFGAALRSGDSVDLIWVPDQRLQPDVLTKRVLTGVTLLGLRTGNGSDPERSAQETTPAVALLALTAAEAEQVAALEQVGKFVLAYTPPGADEVVTPGYRAPAPRQQPPTGSQGGWDGQAGGG